MKALRFFAALASPSADPDRETDRHDQEGAGDLDDRAADAAVREERHYEDSNHRPVQV